MSPHFLAGQECCDFLESVRALYDRATLCANDVHTRRQDQMTDVHRNGHVGNCITHVQIFTVGALFALFLFYAMAQNNKIKKCDSLYEFAAQSG